jgi:hypothetical protein
MSELPDLEHLENELNATIAVTTQMFNERFFVTFSTRIGDRVLLYSSKKKQLLIEQKEGTKPLAEVSLLPRAELADHLPRLWAIGEAHEGAIAQEIQGTIEKLFQFVKAKSAKP